MNTLKHAKFVVSLERLHTKYPTLTSKDVANLWDQISAEAQAKKEIA